MKTRFILTALAAALLTLVSPAFGQLGIGIPSSPRESPSLVSLHLTFEKVEGDQLRGLAVAEIDEGWHINSAKPLDEFAIPTVLTITSPDLEVSQIDYPPHIERTFDFAGGKLAVYEGSVRIPFVGTVKARAGKVVATLRYQACNDKICLPPNEAKAEASFGDVEAPPAAGSVSGSKATTTSAGTDAPPIAAEKFTPLSSAPPAGTEQRDRPWSDVGGAFASRGLLLTLGIVFLAGLALNLTPCVYPLIPITLAFFSSQSQGSRLQRFGLSSVYVLGLALTYSILGVISALSGRIFGATLQSTGVLVFFAALMVVLAASMFGLYEIRVPHFISDRASGRAGYAGAATMGLLVGIVAAPCVGPFVVSLIALVGTLGNPWIGFLLFFVLALGLGLPYLVLGLFSSAISSIPRSGAWMDQIKKAMGFVLIAMAFYFLRPVVGDTVYTWGIVGSLLFGALFLLFGGRRAGETGRAVRIGAAVVLLVGSAVFAMPRGGGEEIPWKEYDETVLASARQSGKPVMIDFYADWCLPCKELDERTFSDPKVSALAESFVPVKADLTRADDPLTKELSARYRIIGVPTIVFLDARGQEIESARLSGFEPADRFAARMSGLVVD